MSERQTCEVPLCEEPRRLERVTFRHVALCGEHWRDALAGRLDATLAHVGSSQPILLMPAEAMHRYMQITGGIELFGDLDE